MFPAIPDGLGPAVVGVNILNGYSIVAAMPTGAGPRYTYRFPAGALLVSKCRFLPFVGSGVILTR